MNRREMFQRIAGVGLAASVVPAVDAKTPIQDYLSYQDYLLRWTGWKPSQDYVWLVGQWLAWPSRGFGKEIDDRQPLLYLNVPGMIGGPYLPGHVFNISNRSRGYVTRDTSDREREFLITEGMEYIEQLVDAFRRRPHRDIGWRCPLYNFPMTDGRGIVAENDNIPR